MSIPIIGHSANHLRQKFSQSVGLPIRDALPAEAIEAVIRSEGATYRHPRYGGLEIRTAATLGFVHPDLRLEPTTPMQVRRSKQSAWSHRCPAPGNR